MRLTIQLHRQGEAIRKLRGLGWEGNLDEMREGRFPDWDGQTRQKQGKLRAPAA
jgi:hypothetical protein